MKTVCLWITCACFLFFSIPLTAQTALDSLQQAYEQQGEDTLRLSLANDLVNAYLYREPALARKYAQEGLALAKQLGDRTRQTLFYYQIALCLTHDRDSGVVYLDSAWHLAELNQDLRWKSNIRYAYALDAFDRGELDRAEVLGKETLAIDEERGDSLGIALSYGFLGNIHRNRGDYEQALEAILTSLKWLQATDKKDRIADAYNTLAALEYNLKHFEQAVAYNQQAIALYKEIGDISYLSQALNDMGAQYVGMDSLEQAKKAYEEALAAARQVNWQPIIGTILGNLGNLYTQMGQPEEGLPYLQESLEVLQSLAANRKIAITQSQLGNAYVEMGNGAKALTYLHPAVESLRNSNSRGPLATALSRRSRAYELIGDYQAALADHQRLKMLSDSVLNEEKIQQIERMRVQFETAQKETALALEQAENARLKEEIRARKLQNTLYGVGLITLLVSLALIWLGFKYRLRQQRLEQEKQEAIHQKEILFKQRELAAQTLHLVHKNTLMTDVNDILQQVNTDENSFSQAYKRIKGLMNIDEEAQKDWQAYKAYFTEVYHDFDTRFQQEFGEMSDSELKLASLLKMKLSTKEIAAILHVQPESIRKSKYRLKKKLGLDKETDLGSFLGGY